jgi:hypothetical protein
LWNHQKKCQLRSVIQFQLGICIRQIFIGRAQLIGINRLLWRCRLYQAKIF